jgi:hypothetical protein
MEVLPTLITAVLLKPVETMVSSATKAPIFAGTKEAAFAGFNSTVPENSEITPLWAKAQKAAPASSNPIHKVLFIIKTPLISSLSV